MIALGVSDVQSACGSKPSMIMEDIRCTRLLTFQVSGIDTASDNHARLPYHDGISCSDSARRHEIKPCSLSLSSEPLASGSLWFSTAVA